jgi:hypothetical protein
LIEIGQIRIDGHNSSSPREHHLCTTTNNHNNNKKISGGGCCVSRKVSSTKVFEDTTMTQRKIKHKNMICPSMSMKMEANAIVGSLHTYITLFSDNHEKI